MLACVRIISPQGGLGFARKRASRFDANILDQSLGVLFQIAINAHAFAPDTRFSSEGKTRLLFPLIIEMEFVIHISVQGNPNSDKLLVSPALTCLEVRRAQVLTRMVIVVSFAVRRAASLVEAGAD